MNNFLATEHKPLRVAVQSGLPDTSQAPLITDLIALIQDEAKARGQRLQRYELHPEGYSDRFAVSVYWLVGDLADNLRVSTLDEAHEVLSEQISTRLPGIWDDTQDCEPVLHDLRWLLKLVTEANEREGFAPAHRAEPPSKSLEKTLTPTRKPSEQVEAEMNNIPAINPIAVADLTIVRGLPAALNAPRLAEVLSQIQAEAELRSQRLERIELRKKGDSECDARVFWVVADLPDELGFENVYDAQQAIEEEIHVRSVGEHEVGDNPAARLGALHHLLALVKEANERDAFNALDAEGRNGGLVFPDEPLSCGLQVLTAFQDGLPWSKAVSDVQRLAIRLDGCLVIVLVALDHVTRIEGYAAYWAILTDEVPSRLRDTEQVRSWLSSMIRARTSVLPSDAMTLSALESVRVQAERRLAESGG